MNNTEGTKMRGRVNQVGSAVEIAPVDGAFLTYAVLLEYLGEPVYIDDLDDEGKLPKPQDPVRKNSIFEGWYADPACTKPYDFDVVVTKTLTLYAKWKIDPATLPEPGTVHFNDINQGYWYQESTIYVAENGYMVGTDNEVFSPNQNLSRGMLTAVLWRVEGSPILSSYDFSSTDVKKGKYYYDAVHWAYAYDIVAGVDYYGNFAPDDAITREQIAAIVYRYAKFKGYDMSATHDLSTFKDANEVSDYAKDAMKWAVSNGIIQGDNNQLKPKSTATRAEAAAIIHRFCESFQ